MFRFMGLCLGTLIRVLRARRSLLLENLALRQQLAVMKRGHPWPRLDLVDKLFWVAVRRFWSGWQKRAPKRALLHPRWFQRNQPNSCEARRRSVHGLQSEAGPLIHFEGFASRLFCRAGYE
jgi:hypothetical protein